MCFCVWKSANRYFNTFKEKLEKRMETNRKENLIEKTTTVGEK